MSAHTLTATELASKAQAGRSLFSEAIRRLKRNRLVMVCFVILLAYFLIALLVQLGLVASAWNEPVGESYLAPNGSGVNFWFGTDFLGRSVLLKALYGVKVAFLVGFAATLISIPIGIFLGAMAGYFGGIVDEIIVWLYTTLSSIPYIMLVMAIAFVLGKGLPVVCIALGITGWIGLCRVIRGEFLKHKNREYVLAAKAIGASHTSRIFRHILPNVFHQVIIHFSIAFPSAVKAEVILSYLGLGAQLEPSWGKMIDDAKQEIVRDPTVWWQGGAATLAMFFLVLAFNICGDAVRDALDPKLKDK